MLPRVIGITGLAGAGKDTLADYLVKEHGYTKYSLASPIKQLLNERFGWTDEEWLDREWKETPHRRCGYGVRRNQGWIGKVEEFSPRSWAQWLGTDVGRTIGGEDVWVNLMRKFSWTVDKLVVSDVRFDNEANAIHNLGGKVIKIDRVLAVPVRAHASEMGVSSQLIDAFVWNDGTIDRLTETAVNALEICNV
jgi:hypothetical protein